MKSMQCKTMHFWITIEYQENYASKGHMNKEWKVFFLKIELRLLLLRLVK